MRSFIAFAIISCLLSCQGKTPGDHKTVIVPQKDKLDTKKDTPNPYVDKDVSVMDMAYFPPDYPSLKMHHLIATAPFVRVIYSRPIKLGRKIFGELLPYGKPWRLGANEASEIEFFKSASIQDKKVSAGRYIIYCIPEPTKWTIILNSDLFTWGKEIDSSKDLFRFEVPVTKPSATCEYFTMLFRDEGENHTGLLMAWDDVLATLPIKF